MKKINFLTITLLLVLFSSACKKDGNGSGSFFSCQLDGAKYYVDGLYAYATNFSDDTVIYGVKDQGEGETIYISITKGTTKGTYPFDGDKYFGYYVDKSNKAHASIWGAGNGSVTIDEIDATHIKGTFQFNAYDADTETVKKEIKSGEFDVEIR
jgi:hypothetical protein